MRYLCFCVVHKLCTSVLCVTEGSLFWRRFIRYGMGWRAGIILLRTWHMMVNGFISADNFNSFVSATLRKRCLLASDLITKPAEKSLWEMHMLFETHSVLSINIDILCWEYCMDILWQVPVVVEYTYIHSMLRPYIVEMGRAEAHSLCSLARRVYCEWIEIAVQYRMGSIDVVMGSEVYSAHIAVDYLMLRVCCVKLCIPLYNTLYVAWLRLIVWI